MNLIIHTIQQGDTLYKLSVEYGVPLSDIVETNQIRNADNLALGQTIIIPTTNQVHIVQSGQSLYSIAQSYGIPLSDLLAANPDLIAPYTIYPGQLITIPGESEKLRTIEVNGYMFPSISDEVLEKTLPNLTYASIFSYGLTESGDLIMLDDDQRIIDAAKAQNVAPMMVVANVEEGEGFNTDTVSNFLNNNTAKQNFINNVLGVLRTKGYYGLNIDFEYIPPKDREMYNSFLRTLKMRLANEGFILTTAVAPKNSDSQTGLLYEAHDYAAHGEIADRVIIMTYEWGYLMGPPMAVSPIHQIRKVLDYAVQKIPSDKILMSLPGYGYDWTLPYQPGTAATNLSIVQATELAARVGAQIEFDDESQTPFFQYYDQSGNLHIVWFEDANSAKQKLLLIDEYDLAGVSYWTLNQYWPQNWVVLNSLYNVKKLL